MRLEGYTAMKGFVVPNYWYEEGDKREQYWVDSQNLWYHKFCEWPEDNGLEDENGDPILDENGEPKEDPRKWWIIAPYKPEGVTITKENKDLVKWLVEDCYLGVKDYEYYEWDFDNHCIKKE